MIEKFINFIEEERANDEALFLIEKLRNIDVNDNDINEIANLIIDKSIKRANKNEEILFLNKVKEFLNVAI